MAAAQQMVTCIARLPCKSIGPENTTRPKKLLYANALRKTQSQNIRAENYATTTLRHDHREYDTTTLQHVSGMDMTRLQHAEVCQCRLRDAARRSTVRLQDQYSYTLQGAATTPREQLDQRERGRPPRHDPPSIPPPQMLPSSSPLCAIAFAPAAAPPPRGFAAAGAPESVWASASACRCSWQSRARPGPRGGGRVRAFHGAASSTAAPRPRRRSGSALGFRGVRCGSSQRALLGVVKSRRRGREWAISVEENSRAVRVGGCEGGIVIETARYLLIAFPRLLLRKHMCGYPFRSRLRPIPKKKQRGYQHQLQYPEETPSPGTLQRVTLCGFCCEVVLLCSCAKHHNENDAGKDARYLPVF